MIKRFVILRRKTGMSTAEFHKYWRDIHGPLIAAIPGVRRYVQYHVSSEIEVGDNEDPVDGIAELWFDSHSAQRDAWDTEQYARAVADEPNLFDMTTHSIHPVMETATVALIP